MTVFSDILTLSDVELSETIGKKIKMMRLNMNMTRDELQKISGVHSKTIGDFENGKNVTLLTLIAILRGLKGLYMLVSLLEEESVSPVMVAKLGGDVPKRASGTSRRR